MKEENKKNILIWETLSFLGGGQRVSLQVGNALRKSGLYNVDFIIPEEGPFSQSLMEEGFNYYILPIGNYSLGKKKVMDYIKFSFNTLGVLPRIYKLQRKKKYDILYVGGTRALIWGAVVGRILNLPVFWHVHHVFSDSKVVWFLRQFGKMSIVKKVLCVSKCVREQYPVLYKKSEVLYNGVDVSRFNQKVYDESFLAEIGIPNKSTIISFIGVLQKLKRQDVLIKALPSILKKYPNTFVLLVGAAREGDDYENNLKHFVHSLGLKENVYFLGARNDVPRILASTTITVLAMGEEACPLVVLESCAAGVPVVGPDVAGAAELIDLSGAGLKYRFNNSDDLAKVLLKLLGSGEILQEISNAGKLFADKHSMEEFDKSIQNVFLGIE